MKKSSLFLTILLIVSILLTACGKAPEPNPDANGSSEPLENQICLVDGNATLFAIFCDVTNEKDKVFAVQLQELLINTYGVQLPVRSASSAGEQEHRIFVGSAGLTAFGMTGAISGQDAVIRTDGQSVLLYATDGGMYQLLEIILRDRYFQTKGSSLYMKDGIDFLYSRDHREGEHYGSSVALRCDGSVSYTLVYSEVEDPGGKVSGLYADALREQTGMAVSAAPDTGSYEYEILFGSCDRSEVRQLRSNADKPGDYVVAVRNGKPVILGCEKIDRLYALFTFAEMIGAADGVLYESDFYLSERNGVSQTLNLPVVNRLYREAWGTYSSYVERRLAEMSESDRRDQKLVDLLIRRLNGGFAVAVGSSSALYQGQIVKTDPQNYSAKTHLVDGDIWIATAFLEHFFGASAGASQDGFSNLSAYLNTQSGYTLCYKEKQKVAIVLPAGAESFERDNTGVDGFRNLEYVNRMSEFFFNPLRPEPGTAAEQTRIVIDEAEFDPDLIYDYQLQSHVTNFSPGIRVRFEEGRETIYVSYETCNAIEMAANKETGNTTYLKRSRDGGATWELLGAVYGMRWGTLFESQGQLWLMGSDIETGKTLLASYALTTGEFRSKLLSVSLGGGAPCAVVEAGGRLWRASSMVCSIPVGADLYAEGNWTVTARASSVFTLKDFIAMTGTPVADRINADGYDLGEGNMVVRPDGKICAMFRANTAPEYGYAVILEVSEDGRSLRQLPDRKSLVKFPSTASKFTVLYDETLECYLTITSLPVNDSKTWGAYNARNVMGLAVSQDLVNWKVVDVLFADRAMVNETVSRFSHAYQYADFDFSGDDLRVIVREATGETAHYHDGKYITLYTIQNYRELIAPVLAEA